MNLLDVHCYSAVSGYIQFLYHEMGWRNVAGLLGGIWSDEGHEPLDIAIWVDWKAYVSSLNKKNVTMSAVSDDQGWRCMVMFLDHVFKTGEEDLMVVMDGMHIIDDVPKNKAYVELWNNSYRFATKNVARGTWH